ncbi:predicted protein [Naegleria gruberi]|uniref:Predicted protein n=1 Tax=Naegleria gruberi TaxID=5762 RepID=D2V7W4_NAEGR|nr:uncharacterized protein NAEGRDRAFT_64945 [Naegleria gruberi]EFC47075.1 predicted protein [Naegleria gruberi]|eukprot:XP_002679819.1 predicted protein [Naegleria gruberi strain NEG-M]
MLDGGFTIVSNNNNNNNQRRGNNTQQALMMASSWKKKRKVLAQAEQEQQNPNNSLGTHGGKMMIDLIEFNPIRFESQLEKVREKLSEFILNCFINDNYQYITHQVICYGIGDFVTDKIALSQFKVLLSLLERLKEKMNQQETYSMFHV